MPSPAYLIAMLQARADDDAETLTELRDVLADPESAEALLEQVESGQDDDDDTAEVVTGKAFRKGDGPAAEVLNLLKTATDDERSGLKVYFSPEGPMYWVDQMDWHDGELGGRVIAAAEKALGVEAEEGYKHTKDDAGTVPVGPAVWTFNEGPNPKALPDGGEWQDLTSETHR